MKYIHKFLAPGLLITWCFVFLNSCKDPLLEDNTILLPSDTIGLSRIDTLQIKAWTVSDQLQQTHDAEYGVVGNMKDFWFGKTIGGIYTQVKINRTNYAFPTGAVYDSAVLSLRYSGKYGKFDKPVDLAVYELNEFINPSAIYYSSQTFAVKPTPVGLINNFIPNLSDSLQVGTSILPPHLRVKLSDQLGQRIFTASATDLADDNTFQNVLKGFYITTNSFQNGNGVVYLDLHNSISGLTVYFHDTASKSLKLSINNDDNTARVRHFDHHYSGGIIQQTLDVNSVNGDSILFLQAGSGSNIKIEIPYLDSIPKNILINKAEFVFTVHPDVLGEDTIYNLPAALTLLRKNASGGTEKFDDASTNVFGGTRVTEVVSGTSLQRYRFNVTRFMQGFLQGKYPNYGFVLEHYVKSTNVERVLISNRKQSAYQMQLLITYTKL